MNNSDSYNLKQASEYLNMGVSTLQDRAARGKVPGAKIGKAWVFPKDKLREWFHNEVDHQTKKRELVESRPIKPKTDPSPKGGRPRSEIPEL